MELPPGLLDQVDLLVVNETEARAITGAASNLAALLTLVPRVVLTLSGNGSRYADREGRDVHVPAFPVRVVDTTAAGDAFCGALAVAWAEGRDLLDAVRWANAAGAAAVRKVGASNGLPDRAEIDAIFGG
jgi:ribokinase